MNQYKVLKTFRDKQTKEVYKAGKSIELSDERADEIVTNLSGLGVFIEKEEEEFDREKAKETLKELGVEFKGNASNETLMSLLAEKTGE